MELCEPQLSYLGGPTLQPLGQIFGGALEIYGTDTLQGPSDHPVMLNHQSFDNCRIVDFLYSTVDSDWDILIHSDRRWFEHGSTWSTFHPLMVEFIWFFVLFIAWIFRDSWLRFMSTRAHTVHTLEETDMGKSRASESLQKTAHS